MIRMSVEGISVDASAGSAVLVLRDDGDATLAIAIGIAEATSIAKELEGIEFPRPLTHDLMIASLEALGATLVSIEVVDLREETYFAELVLRDAAGAVRRIDARPSDAIALAVRVDVPILVHRHVLGLEGTQDIPSPTDKESWKRLLGEMDPEDFGKYKM